MSNAHWFSSERQDWQTPQSFFDHWDDKYGFDLDAAASFDNRKCDRYFDEEDDALSQPWEGTVWCNPPYSNQIGKWIRKGYEEAQKGATVVMLVPARTDTRWWHEYVMRAAEIWFVKGRLRFGGSAANAPFPSAVVVFHRIRSAKPEIHTMDRIRDGEERIA